MKIKIKDFTIEMDVKKNGIEFEVRSPDGETHKGDCYLTMAGLTWCQGRTSKDNGLRIGWNDFIAVMSSKASLEAAIKAAKKA